MTLKITEHILSIPPYISTSWDHVQRIQSEENKDKKLTLHVHLTDGTLVTLANLELDIVKEIFLCHQKFLDGQKIPSKETPSTHPSSPQSIQNLMGLNPEQIAAFQMRLGPGGTGNVAGGLEGLESTFQHNPAQASLPDLPAEMVQKIAAIARIVTNGDMGSFPKPEPHCNCMHCQVARAIHNDTTNPQTEPTLEPVTQEDLKFRDWEITQEGENLYTATNPLDKQEQYSVFLGKPVGCTCGKPDCEHIRAVLLS